MNTFLLYMYYKNDGIINKVCMFMSNLILLAGYQEITTLFYMFYLCIYVILFTSYFNGCDFIKDTILGRPKRDLMQLYSFNATVFISVSLSCFKISCLSGPYAVITGPHYHAFVARHWLFEIAILFSVRSVGV
jgi:hypothetical protein